MFDGGCMCEKSGVRREKRKKRGQGMVCSGSRFPSPAPTAGMAAYAVKSEEQKVEKKDERESRRERK
jgi:hypothetical protein